MSPVQLSFQDPAIRHMSLALDCGKMVHVLQAKVFPRLDYLIQRCDIDRIKYKPGKNCLVCYRLQLSRADDGSSAQRLLSARFYEPGGSHSRHARARRVSRPENGIAPSLIHLPEFDCLIWSFPNDRKLTALPLICDQSSLAREILPGVVASHWGNQWHISHVRSTIVHYLPEHSCCVRVGFRLTHAVTGEIQHPVLYGKTYYNDQGHRTMQAMGQLWQSTARRQGRLSIPQPLNHLEPWQLFWQREVAGIPVLELLRKDPAFSRQLADVAANVAALHQTPLAPMDGGSSRDPLTNLQRVLTLVVQVRPGLAGELEQLIRHLFHTRPQAHKRPLATLHGDLHLKNILSDNGRVVLIDLDSLHQGDPLEDLGSLIASLLNLSLLGQLDRTSAHRMIDQFLSHYRRHIPWQIDPDDLRWHVAAALLSERLARSITRLKSGRLALLRPLLELAGSIALGQQQPLWMGSVSGVRG